MARRTKWSPEREEAILNALRVGNTRAASAEAAGISRETLYNWIAADSAFLYKVTQAEAQAELRFLAQVAKHAATSPQAAQWWLERRRHEEYGRRDVVDLTVDVRREVERLAGSPEEAAAAVAEVERLMASQHR